MNTRGLPLLMFFFLLIIYSPPTMAQSEIIISYKNKIISTSKDTEYAASVLKSYLDKAFKNSFEIIPESQKDPNLSEIILEISNSESKNKNEFTIKTDSKSLYLIAQSKKYLVYAVYTLL